MKKILLICALIGAGFVDAYALDTLLSTDTGAQMRTKVNGNFSDHETRVAAVESGKADKSAVIRYWSDWPDASPGNTLAVGTIVAYDGKLYKVTQEFVKTEGATPAAFTSYFSEVTGSGATYTAGTGISIDDGVISSTVVDTDTFASWDKDYDDLTNKPTIPSTATQIGITDLDELFTATTVETALAENRALINAGAAGYSDENAQDAVGGMFSGNTETGIAITYDDATAKINAVVSESDPVFGAWDKDYADLINTPTVGTSANNLVQLNSSAQLPAVSGALLTDSFTGTLIGSQTTHKAAIQAIATELDSAIDITAGTGITITDGAISVTANTYEPAGITESDISDLGGTVYLKTAIDTQSEVEAIWNVSLLNEVSAKTVTLPSNTTIADGAFTLVQTDTISGMSATTDVPDIGYQTDPTTVDGFDFTSGPVLSVIPRVNVSAGKVDVYFRNDTGETITTDADMIINVKVIR